VPDDLVLTDVQRRAAKELATLHAELERRRSENRLAYYKPYPKQAEFHALGATKRERALIAGNQVGKTYCAAAEVAMHLTGRYPPDWRGAIFTKPVLAWALGITQTSTRDTAQLQLLGPMGELGTGFLPREAIKDVRMGRGISDSVDTAAIEHRRGGTSRLVFKAYQMGRLALQGPSVDVLWPDEEPDEYALYSELLARMTARPDARLLATFTPLLGQTRIVQRFMGEPDPSRAYVTMSLADAAHISPADRAKIEAAYPEHERDARVRGVPLLGAGRVFSAPESALVVPGFAIPDHFARLAAIDRGKGGHLTAVVFLARDRETDVVYIHDVATFPGNTPLPVVASAIRQRGGDVRVAWPRDLSEADPQSGRPIAALFRQEGVKMLPEPAQFEDGSVSVEAGLLLMQTRIEAGTLKIFESCAEPFLAEYRVYHRKDGRIVKEQDDVLDAVRYGLMCLRHARFAGPVWDMRIGQWVDPSTGRPAERRAVRIAEGVDFDVFNPRGDHSPGW
jgi:phage terminase large subunit-like protein